MQFAKWNLSFFGGGGGEISDSSGDSAAGSCEIFCYHSFDSRVGSKILHQFILMIDSDLLK